MMTNIEGKTYGWRWETMWGGGDGDNDDMLKDNGNDNQILIIMRTNSGNGIRDNDGLEGNNANNNGE